MPLIAKETTPPKKEQLNVRVDPDLVEMICRYCDLAESNHNYVIEQLLRYVLEKDPRPPDMGLGLFHGVGPLLLAKVQYSRRISAQPCQNKL